MKECKNGEKMFDLSPYAALVTGATGGIGEAIARKLHAQGATVALSVTRKNALEEIAQDLKERVFILPCNLCHSEEVEALIPTAENLMGKVDVLINNAGITQDNLALRLKDDDWQKVIDMNLTSVFKLSRSGVKTMMRRRYGRIINISSVIGSTGNVGQANYAAAKAGLEGLSKSLAQEVATRNITVNCVAPGYIETKMTQGLPENVKNAILGKIPMQRIGSPDDVAAACSFLASKEASYITGQVIHVNGGMYM